MPKYQCSTCDKIFKQKSQFDYHSNRKNKCQKHLNDTSNSNQDTLNSTSVTLNSTSVTPNNISNSTHAFPDEKLVGISFAK